jgi:hypothetical protein
VLSRELIELALLQLLAKGAEGKTQHGDGGAQAKGLL